MIHAEQARQRAALIIARIKADEANGTPREKTRLPLCGKKGAQGEERGEEGRRTGPPLQSEGWAPEGRAPHMESSATDSV